MSERHRRARAISPWPSSPSSFLLDAFFPTSASTSVSSSLSNHSCTSSSATLHGYHDRGVGAVGVSTSESATGAVPPLLGLQRLAGNAFSLRQVPAPWPTSVDVHPAPPRGIHSPRRLTQYTDTTIPTAAGGTTMPMRAAAAVPNTYSTPDTSPRASWPMWSQPLPVAGGERPEEVGASPLWQSLPPPHQPQQQLQRHQQQQQYVPIMLSDLPYPRPQPRSLPASSRHHKKRSVTSTRVPQNPNVRPPPAHGNTHRVSQPSLSTSCNGGGETCSGSTPLSPALLPLPRSFQEMSGLASPQTQSLRSGASMPRPHALCSIHDARAAATTTLLQLPARPHVWHPVGQEDSATPPVGRDTTAQAEHRSTSCLTQPLPQSVGRGAAQPRPQATSGPTSAAQLEGLRALFAQYLSAQRALEPVLQRLQIPPAKYLPLTLQERVLAQVEEFAAQLEKRTSSSTAACGDHLDMQLAAHTAEGLQQQQQQQQKPLQKSSRSITPRPSVMLRHSDDVAWDAILSFLPVPTVAAHATLRAISPSLRRRLEQHAWSWLVESVRTSVCPFVGENGAAPHVRDAYARLDGRERQYVGSVPVARCSPAPVPRRHGQPVGGERLLDGSVLLDCERQCLLLDRAWREGWLHRRARSHLRYLAPRWSHAAALRFLRRNPLRIHVDGALVDVLRPRRGLQGGGGGGGTDGAAVATGSEDLQINTVSRAGLTPPPTPSLLDGRPSAALSVTRKLLGDAVSAISRERGRSADTTTRAQLSCRLTPVTGPGSATNVDFATATEAAAARTLDNSQVEEAPAGATLERGSAGRAAKGALSDVYPSQQHPYFRHASLPVLVEDVNGTIHLFCSRATVMDSEAMQGIIRGWLPHHHRLRRQPVYTMAADFLLVRDPSNCASAAEVYGGGEVDYVICTETPTTAEMAARQAASAAHGDLAPAASAEVAHRTHAVLAGDGSSSTVAAKHDARRLGCLAVDCCAPARDCSPGGDPLHRLFHARLQEWCTKREDVVFRMDYVDPPWLMVGNAAGPQPRPLALHLTERQIPWLAQQLCPDSDAGGLIDLQELHLCVAEALLLPGWVSAWQWCLSVLRNRRNLLVVSVVTSPVAPSMSLEGNSPPASVVGNGAGVTAAAAAVMDRSGGATDAVADPTSTIFLDSVRSIASVQLLDLHGISPDAVVALFHADAEDQKEPPPPQHQSQKQVQCVVTSSGGDERVFARPRLTRLRDFYVTVRRGSHSAGASPRSVYTGELSVSASVFPSLQVLWLDAPRLRHVALDSLLVLRELHIISDAALLCSSLRGVEALPCLEVLHVERAVIDDCSFFGHCRALRELLLHGCRLSMALLAAAAESDAVVGGAGHRSCGRSNNLRGGWGGGGEASVVEELQGVERAPSLETLSLCYTEEIRHLGNFARCHTLRRVLLTRCNGVSTGSIAGFERLPQLELLALEYTRVSGLAHLATAPALRVLRVDGCKRVLRSSVLGLEMAPHLVELSLQDTNVSTVANFGSGGACLRSLDLSGCRHMDVDGLQGIQALPLLEVLSLSHTPITDVAFLADCLRLTTLYVEGCTALLPTALEELRGAPVLQRVIANGCTSLTRVGLLGRCRSLEVLSLAGAVALTTAGVEGLERSVRLRFLDLAGTAVHSLCFLARGCRGLVFLSIKGCTRLAHAAELHGLETLTRLETLNMEDLSLVGRLDFLAMSASLLYVSFAGCTGLTDEDVCLLRRSDICTAIP